MNRRDFVARAVAGAAVLQREMKGFAVAEGTIQIRIDASVSGAPINPMIFGGYMEPATMQVTIKDPDVEASIQLWIGAAERNIHWHKRWGDSKSIVR
jgi:hypothetical protein